MAFFLRPTAPRAQSALSDTELMLYQHAADDRSILGYFRLTYPAFLATG